MQRCYPLLIPGSEESRSIDETKITDESKYKMELDNINVENIKFYRLHTPEGAFMPRLTEVDEFMADYVWENNGDENAVKFSKVAFVKEIIGNKGKYGHLLCNVEPTLEQNEDICFGYTNDRGYLCDLRSVNKIMLKIKGSEKKYRDLLDKGFPRRIHRVQQQIQT